MVKAPFDTSHRHWSKPRPGRSIWHCSSRMATRSSDATTRPYGAPNGGCARLHQLPDSLDARPLPGQPPIRSAVRGVDADGQAAVAGAGGASGRSLPLHRCPLGSCERWGGSWPPQSRARTAWFGTGSCSFSTSPTTQSPKAWATDISVVLNAVLGPDRFPIPVTDVALELSRKWFNDDPLSVVQGAALPGFDRGRDTY